MFCIVCVAKHERLAVVYGLWCKAQCQVYSAVYPLAMQYKFSMLGMSFNRMMDVRSLCGMCQCLLNMVCASSLTVDKLVEVFHPAGNISGSTGC